MRRALHIAAILLLSATSATAQQTQQYLRISAGTGFVINRAGDVVTNAHVLRGCQSITVGTPRGEMQATLRASDTAQDLAVLGIAEGYADTVAPLRWNINGLKVGDGVIVMGYPGQAGLEGHYAFRKTVVTSLSGPDGEAGTLQLASITEMGNSGGPVLDNTGNVIAVISRKALQYRVDAQGNVGSEPIAQADVAITLAALQDFLRANHIAYYESASGLVTYSDGALEQNANRFIVPVHCVQGRVGQPAN